LQNGGKHAILSPLRGTRAGGRPHQDQDFLAANLPGPVGTTPDRRWSRSVARPVFQKDPMMSMFIGEALAGDGNEVAHIDLLIGDKNGPVGTAFANALADQKQGHSNLLAVLTPNVVVKPATVMITKVTIKGAKQAVQMFGPAQKAVADAVADCVKDGVIPKDQCETLCIVCGVFIHWDADDDKKIYEYNYEATKLSIERAMKNEPSVDEMLSKRDSAHPFYAG
jgi:5,6,7,8-tetrahydromethanopterin hydro-lyase